jgi:tRNA G18 (ribose-2'-O)-methylase SpoU
MSLIVVAHNIRSTHNIGSIFRTCDGLGIDEIILSGYTPYPYIKGDTRLPHIYEKLTAQINKTALGAIDLVPFHHSEDIAKEIKNLRQNGYQIIGLEQGQKSIPLPSFSKPEKCCLVLGEEVNGISPEVLALCDDIIEIAMRGKKESFNVSVAAGIALYQLTL